MQRIPVPRASELSFLRRFFWFIVNQLQNFHTVFTQWDFASILEDGSFYQKLAYHFCRMILSCSKNLAKPAMQPYEEKAPMDDVKRCENMDKFEDCRDIPFFLVTPHSYHITSTSNFSPLQFIINNEPITTDDAQLFHQWISEYQSMLNPVDRSHLQLICSQLIENPYSSDQKSPPLKILLEVLGCWTSDMYILNAMNSLISGKSLGTKRLSEVDSITPAVAFMKSIGKLDDRDIPCSQFMLLCTNYLTSLFGSDPGEASIHINSRQYTPHYGSTDETYCWYSSMYHG
jgi:hypothetical protein